MNRRLLFPFLLSLSACVGGTIEVPVEETGSTSDAVIGGTVDNGDSAVGMLYASGGWICTATLISPTVLLTAAHCVQDASASTKFYVTFETQTSGLSLNNFLPVKSTHWNTKFNRSNLGGGYDVAVAILASPITNRTPIPYNTSALGSGDIGKAVRIVGYGNNNGQTASGSGTKRQATVKLNSVGNLIINVGQSGKTTCQGDSGGPTFMNIGGVERVIGVTSYGLVGCGSGGSMTRVDAMGQWIAQYAQPAGGGNPPPTNPPPTNPPPTNPPPATCGAESEDNGTAASADSACSDGNISGSSSGNDVDWFAWSIDGEVSYYVTLAAGSGQTLALYKLVSGQLRTIGSSTSEVARYTPDGGTYYLRVSGGSGAYKVKITLQ
jgi:V8-like Glu-specific endopeptidase